MKQNTIAEILERAQEDRTEILNYALADSTRNGHSMLDDIITSHLNEAMGHHAYIRTEMNALP